MCTEEGTELMKIKNHQNPTLDPIEYEIKDEPSFQETRALFIGNLKSYHDIDTFKQILLTEVENENCSIERAWLNSSRSHCFVLASDAPGATAIRLKLNGKNFTNSNSKEEENSQSLNNNDKLYVDYIPVRAILTWIEQEKEGPMDAIWKIVYEDRPSIENVGTTFKSVSHIMINYDNKDTGYIKIKRHNRNFRKEDLINSIQQRRYDSRNRYNNSRNTSFRNSKYVNPNNSHYHHHHYRPRHHHSDNYNNHYHYGDNSNRSSYQRARSNCNNYNRFSDTYIPSY